MINTSVHVRMSEADLEMLDWTVKETKRDNRGNVLRFALQKLATELGYVPKQQIGKGRKK